MMDNILSPEDAIQFIEKMYPMAILDKEGCYIYVNPAWLAHQNRFTFEEILGQKVTDIIPQSKALYVIQTGKHLIGEFIGKENTFASYIPRFAPDGSIDGCYIYVILQEVSQAMALQKRIDALFNEVNLSQNVQSHAQGARYSLGHIVGKSPALLQLKKEIIRAANTNSTVLIEGETGTGKELVAHSIHAQSKRNNQNFIRVNCSAIPPTLMESEFFGYSSGSFTGAAKQGKMGRFQLADKGSLFLDEINLLPSSIQPKFLRVLQEREIEPIGGVKSIPIDLRVIAASNIPLEELVQRGEFRQDLYYRLDVMCIRIPPLRERIEDMPILIDSLLHRLSDYMGTRIQGVDPQVLELFYDYDWPGNIRELQNVLERAINLSTSSILALEHFDTLQKKIRSSRHYIHASDMAANSLKSSREVLERQLVIDALDATNGNKTEAAKNLRISRTALYKKISKLGIK